MRYPLAILLLLLASHVTFGQTDTLFVAADSLTDKIQLERLDSLQTDFKRNSDSIKQAYIGKAQSISRLRQNYLLKIDSLKSNSLRTPSNPLDTLPINPDVSAYQHKADSLAQQLENLQRTTTAKLDSLKGRVTEKINKLKLSKGSEGKMAELTSVMDKVDVPSFNTEILTKSELDLNAGMPGINLPNVNLPRTNIPLPSANPGMPGVNPNVSALKNDLPKTDLNTGKITDITVQAGSVQQQIKEATSSQEALGKSIEAKAADQLKALPDQKLPDVPGMPGEIPKTGDEAKQQLITQAKKQAINHFAGKEAVLMNAMEKMSKYKQKYESVNSLKDIKDEKWHNAMKGKPLRERLVPAITWQFQSWHDFMLDINPSVGYKLNSNIVIGLGWNQRISFNVPARAFNRYSNVHGFRSYGEYNFKKGFGFRLDLESMNTPKNKRNVNTDVPPQREWVWSALMGIKQKYPIYKNLKGNAQLMYNLFDKNHRSPYTDRINWRIGLEFNFKKKAEVR